MRKITLAEGYIAEIDQVSKDDWSEILHRFKDANIYQTYSYGKIRWGEQNLSHIVLKKNDDIAAIAQLRIFQIPLLGAGIAYLRWGPIWHLIGKKLEIENLHQMIIALYKEYAINRRLLLRICSHEIEGYDDKIRSVFQGEGFIITKFHRTYRTILVDLLPSLEQIRKNLFQKWRNQLNRAKKNGLEIFEGTEDYLYEIFSIIYNEMLTRKRFDPGLSINEFRNIQKDLPSSLKMRFFVSKYNGNPVSAAICSAIGNTGIYLLGATNTEGRRTKGSYLLQWRIIEWLKECGFRWYDLGGINPKRSPGVYHFKVGLAGEDVYHIGQFEYCKSAKSFFSVKAGDLLRDIALKIKRIQTKFIS